MPLHAEMQSQWSQLLFKRRVLGMARAVIAVVVQESAHGSAPADRAGQNVLLGVIGRRYILAADSADWRSFLLKQTVPTREYSGFER